MQRCHACGGIDEAFQAQIIMAMHDIPEAMLDTRFLHWMVGHPDNEHNPHVEEGMNPDQVAHARMRGGRKAALRTQDCDVTR